MTSLSFAAATSVVYGTAHEWISISINTNSYTTASFIFNRYHKSYDKEYHICIVNKFSGDCNLYIWPSIDVKSLVKWYCQSRETCQVHLIVSETLNSRDITAPSKSCISTFNVTRKSGCAKKEYKSFSQEPLQLYSGFRNFRLLLIFSVLKSY